MSENPRSRGTPLGSRFSSNSLSATKSTFRKPIKKTLIQLQKMVDTAKGFRDKHITPITTGKKLSKIRLKQLSQSRKQQIKKDFGVNKI